MGEARGSSAGRAGCLWQGGGSGLSRCVPGVSQPVQHPQGMGPAPGGAGGRGGVRTPSPGARGLPLLSPALSHLRAVAGACGQGTKASLLEIPGSLQRCAVVGQGEGAEQSDPKRPPPRVLLARRASAASSEVGFCAADLKRSTPESIPEQPNKICGNFILSHFKKSNNPLFQTTVYFFPLFFRCATVNMLLWPQSASSAPASRRKQRAGLRYLQSGQSRGISARLCAGFRTHRCW